MSSANNPHPGKAASPWSRGPHCDTARAQEQHRELKRRGPRVYTLKDGTTGTAAEMAARVPGGIDPDTIRRRIDRYGPDPAKVLESKRAVNRRRGHAWRTTHRLQLPGTPPPLEGDG